MERQKIIFIVDDASSNLKLGSDLLSPLYTVYTLDSGNRLFKLLERIRPDLILLDINMPEMDGYEVLRRMKMDAELQTIPVIFLTAYNSDEQEVKGFEMGAIDYITKPFSAPRLLKRIEIQLEMEEQRLALIDYGYTLEHRVNTITADAVNLKNAFLETMSDLAEHRILSGGHIFRTQQYVELLLESIKEGGIYAEELEHINIALAVQSSQLHDIGKISISDTMLSKPGKLSPEEFEIVKTHTSFGEAIIAQIQSRVKDSSFLEYGKIFAKSHHEKWNGQGYPQGLAGEDIPLLGRVMAIADVYDALVTARPYKPAFAHEKAVQIIQDDAGKHFDPVLVEVFMTLHKQFEEIAERHQGGR